MSGKIRTFSGPFWGSGGGRRIGLGDQDEFGHPVRHGDHSGARPGLNVRIMPYSKHYCP
jgi:hypothetical protein